MALTPYCIFKKPIISDKAYKQNKAHNKVLFQVHRDANASEIKKAAEKIFGIKVEKVNILWRPGKNRSVAGKRRIIKGQDEKRALLTLAEGHTLDLFGHVTENAPSSAGQAEVSND